MDFPFIYGAQYYRAPTPEREHWAEDLRRMAENGFNVVKFWAQWRWTHRDPDQFYFDDLDELMDLAAQNGLSVTINVIFDVAPNWIYDTYPNCRMITSEGRIVEPTAQNCRQIGGYPGPCYNHDAARTAREMFLRKVVERYGNHPAMGMWDVWNEPELCFPFREARESTLLCYCENCQRQFRSWLRKRYAGIEHLNSVWGRCYNNWDEVEAPRGRSVFTDMVDWRLFFNDVMAGEARMRVTTAKSIDASHPVYLHPVPNTLSPFNPVTGVDDFLMSEGCDCFAGTTNGVPTFPLQTISSGKGRVSYNVESHLRYGWLGMYPKPLTLRAFADAFVPQIGLGIKGFMHWQYRCEVLGGESPAWGLLDVDGRPGVTHEGATDFWKKLAPFAQRLMDAPIETAEVAVLKSVPNELFHWSVYGGFDQLMNSYEAYTQLLYRGNARMAYVDDRTVEQGIPESIKLLIVPNCYAMYQPVADALAQWVANGGTLVCEAHTGGYDLTRGRHSVAQPGLGLSAAFGLREARATAVPHLGVSQSAVVRDNMPSDLIKALDAFGLAGGEALPLVTVDGEMLWGLSRYTEVEGEGAEALASLPGYGPCVAKKSVGQGTVYYIGTLAGNMWLNTGSPGLESLIRGAFASAGVRTGADRLPWCPKGVRADYLRTPDGTAIALSNRTTETVDLTIPADEPVSGIYTGQPAPGPVRLEGGQAELFVPDRWIAG